MVQDILTVLYMVLLRIVVPIVAIVVLGYLVNWLLKRPEVRGVSPRLMFGGSLVALLWTVALGVTFLRFFRGFDTVTNMSDRFPWGIWIGIDVMSGVALAAGGFVIAGMVYVFNLEKYHPLVRPAILTAFLGYLLVMAGLIFDLGRPYFFWRALISGQIHSIMFEVGWCVTLYTTVLALEFSPIVLEKLNERWNMQRPLQLIRKITIPLVITGMLLSTLHQSSLGSLFLLLPEKLYPLWWSPMLPVLFWVSAIAVGLCMTIVEASMSARAFKRTLESELLADLGRAASVVLFIYLALKTLDLVARGVWPLVMVLNVQGLSFLLEMGLGVVLPAVIFSSRRRCENPTLLFRAALMVVLGVVLNRLNVSIVGMWAYTGPVYLPSWGEITITVSLITLGVVVYGLAAKFLPVFPAEQAHA